MTIYQCGAKRVEWAAPDRQGHGFYTYYRETECPLIEKSRYVYNERAGTESVIFFGRDGTEKTVSRKIKTPACVEFSTHGIAVSYDGKSFYTCNGNFVYCFDSADFRRKWLNKTGDCGNIFTAADGKEIFCTVRKRGLVALDAENGVETGCVKCPEPDIYRLNEDIFIIGISMGYFNAYKFTGLEKTGRIKTSDITRDGRKWVFRGAWLEKGNIKFDAFTRDGGAEIFTYTPDFPLEVSGDENR